MKKDTVLELFKRFQENNPTPETELNYTNTYTLLVAVALSAQSTDKGVNKATALFFDKVDTPEKMVALGEEALRDYIKTIGLYKTKAKNVIALSKMLVEKFGSQVPDNRKDLESLPGVGRKTANVILSIAFDKDEIAVDTHIFRLSNRLKLAPGKDVVEVEKKLQKVIPKQYIKNAHHWLILHGRYICKAQRPLCEECFIKDLCPSCTTP